MRRRLLGGRDGITVSAFCLGTLPFGTAVDESTSFAILDRFVEAGGTFIDTSNNYAVWVEEAEGGESERLIGRWLASRGLRDDIVVGTKVGAMPKSWRGPDWPANAEGLSARAIRAGLEGSLRRLGAERIDLYYAHIEDRSVPLEESVAAFADLVSEGVIRLAGCSNHTADRIARARAIATARGWAPFRAVQQRHTYLRPRPDADFTVQEVLTDGLVDYVERQRDLSLLAYSTLLGGAYDRPDRPVPSRYVHSGTVRKLSVLREVAAELGATAGQVVLAWLLDGRVPVIPVLGVSSVGQLEECLAADGLELDGDQRRRLDEG